MNAIHYFKTSTIKTKAMKTAQEIYKEYWAEWANDVFVNEPELSSDDLRGEDEHLWIYEAMNEYAKQQAIAFAIWLMKVDTIALNEDSIGDYYDLYYAAHVET